MTKQLYKHLFIFYIFLAATQIYLFFSLAAQCYFADSEIWLLTMSQQILNIGYLSSIYYKISFHFMTYIFSHFAPSEVAVYLWARAGWAFVAIISLILITVIVAQSFKAKEAILPCFIFLITNGMFFNQGFRIRADILTLLVHAIIIFYFIKKQNKKVLYSDYIILIFLNLILLSTTPKSIYFWFCQIILASAIFVNTKDHKTSFIRWLVAGHIAPIAIISFTVIVNSFFYRVENLAKVIATALDFFLKTNQTQLENPGYLSLTGFHYLFSFAYMDTVHAVIIYLLLLIIITKTLAKPKGFFSHWNNEKAMQIYAFFLALVAILHNHKLPFFLAVCLTPILAISFMTIYQIIRKRSPSIAVLFAIILTCFGLQRSYHQLNLNLNLNSNKLQLEAINNLDAYTKDYPNIKIYDVIGILPRKTKVFAFTGPSEVAHKAFTLWKIRIAQPDVIIQTYKTLFLQPELQKYLNENMVPIAHGIWAKGRFINPITTPEHFKKSVTIANKSYWIIPISSSDYIYDPKTQSSLAPEDFILLDSNLKTTKEDPSYAAIEKKYINIGLSSISRIDFPASPYNLFRFDTGF